MPGVEVSPTLISTITDTVADEVRAWQSRPLDKLYPILYLDCLMVKTRKHKIWDSLAGVPVIAGAVIMLACIHGSMQLQKQERCCCHQGWT